MISLLFVKSISTSFTRIPSAFNCSVIFVVVGDIRDSDSQRRVLFRFALHHLQDGRLVLRRRLSDLQPLSIDALAVPPGVRSQISRRGVGQYVDILCHCQCVAFLSSKSSSVMVAAAIRSEKIPAPAGPLAAAPAPTPDNPAATACCIVVQ